MKHLSLLHYKIIHQSPRPHRSQLLCHSCGTFGGALRSVSLSRKFGYSSCCITSRQIKPLPQACFTRSYSDQPFRVFLAREKAKHSPPDNLGTTINPEEVTRFLIDCMAYVNAPRKNALQLAEMLVAADQRGHYSHGLNRIEMYMNDVEHGVCAPGALPSIIKQSVSTALVDGNNGLGAVVGNFCTDLAVQKARETGVGWVCARGSNHYGIAGWYAMRASKQGVIGMSFTNTSPVMTPTRATKPVIGSNPISLAAHGKNTNDEFMLDMATCTVAMGKIEILKKKNLPVPHGWAMDKTGHVTTNPDAAIDGSLMPLGGTELNSGFKGYGLAMMIEILCGILSGSQWGPHIRHWLHPERNADLGHGFIAIDPRFFAPGFQDRLTALMKSFRNLEPAEPDKPVLVAGDPEKQMMERNSQAGGVVYHASQIRDYVSYS